MGSGLEVNQAVKVSLWIHMKFNIDNLCEPLQQVCTVSALYLFWQNAV